MANFFQKFKNNLTLTRLFWTGCQAFFGLLPVFVIDPSLHYSFYSSTLIISYMGMSMLGINGIANLRWAKSKLNFTKAKPYFYLINLCGFITLIIYSLFIEYNLLTSLLLIAGLLQNIKILGISYLRNSKNLDVSIFMIQDGFIFLVGSLLLFFVNSELKLIFVLIFAFSGGLIFMTPLLNKYFKTNKNSRNKRVIQIIPLILREGLFLFFSALFITYIPIIARTAANLSQSESFFVSFSVALSIAITIQKASLSYYWVLQKRYWAVKSQGIWRDKSLFKIIILIALTCIFIYLVQLIFDFINPSIQFPLDVLLLTIIITIHRMVASYFRLHILTVMSVADILRNQIVLALVLMILFLLLFFIFNVKSIIIFLVLFITADIFFIYHLPLLKRTNPL